MTPEQAQHILSGEEKHPITSEELIGFDIASEEMDPADEQDMVFLARMVIDARGAFGRPIPYRICIHENTKLTLWTYVPPLP